MWETGLEFWLGILAKHYESPVVIPFHLKPYMSHSKLFVMPFLYSLTSVP